MSLFKDWDDDSEQYEIEKPGVEVYMEQLKHGKKKKPLSEEEKDRLEQAKVVVAGAEFLDTIPHAPWPSRAMLKRRVVLGTPELPVRNGVTRIIYPSGSMYEGEVTDGKRHGLGVYTWKQVRSPPKPNSFDISVHVCICEWESSSFSSRSPPRVT